MEGKLNNYASSKKDVQNQIERIPGAQFKLFDEDIYEENDVKVTRKAPKLEKPDTNILSTPLTITHKHPPGKAYVTLKDFEIKSVIGRGSFGKVFLVALKND